MPWTFAHPAAVLPFRRLGLKNLSFGGLVVGSISPDIGYYVGRFDVAALAHTTLGVLILCLPTGLVLFAMVRVLHRPVANVLPEPHRSALLSMPQVPRLTSLAQTTAQGCAGRTASGAGLFGALRALPLALARGRLCRRSSTLRVVVRSDAAERLDSI
jgi:hypothetical protein